MRIGERIKQRREALGMSAEELGKMIGKSRATIYRYENGYIEDMPITVLEPVAKALQTTPAELMMWKEDSSDDSIGIAKIAKTISDRPDLFQLLQEAERASPDTVYLVLEMLKRINKDRPDV